MKLNNKILLVFLSLLIFASLVTTALASWDIDTFQENSRSYTRDVAKQKGIDLEQKQALLWDLLTSEDRELFEKKFEALDWDIKSAKSVISKAIFKEAGSNKEKRAKSLAKWAKEERELQDIKNKLDIVSEDFYKALAIEFNTGKRPEPKLRFEIAAQEAQKNNKFDPNTFLGKVNIFVQAMFDGSEIDTVAYKKAILWDLLTTGHYETFSKKYDEMMYRLKGSSFFIDQKVLASQSQEQYESAVTRQKEIEDLIDKTKLVSDDFFKVYYKEITEGKKPAYKFSFDLKAINWQLPPENKITQAFAKEWDKANQVVAKALASLNSKKQEQFAGFWINEEQQKYQIDLADRKQNPNKLASSAIIGAYERAQKTLATKTKYDILPYYMSNNLRVQTEKFEDNEVMTVAVRIWGEKRINTKPVYLVKEGGNYKIQSWQVN